MRRFRRNAQSTVEYVMVISIVIAALISMYSIFNYLMMGRLQIIQDYVAEREQE